MVYINKIISSSQIHLCSHNDFDFVSCKLQFSDGEIVGELCTCIYRPPNIVDAGDFEMINLIETFLNLNYAYDIILGDFNMPSID